jgi:vancomycin resistance protein YoaR
MSPKKHTQPEVEKAPRTIPRWRLPFLIVSGVIIGIVALFGAYSMVYARTYLPHTEIGGVAVGGLTKEEAAQKLAAYQQSFLEKNVTLTYEDKTWQLVPKDIGASFSNDQILLDIWNQEKGGSWQHQMKQLVTAPFLATRGEVGFTAISEADENNFRTNILKDIELSHQEVALTISADGATIVPGKAGKRLNRNDFESKMYSVYKHGGTAVALEIEDSAPGLTIEQVEPVKAQVGTILSDPWTLSLGSTQIILDAQKVSALLKPAYQTDAKGLATGIYLDINDEVLTKDFEEWVAQVDEQPTNALLGLDNGVVKVVQEGKSGVKVNQDTTKQTIKSALLSNSIRSRAIAATVEEALPEVRGSTLTALGLTQKIGTATTDYTGSPTNRKGNIALGQKKLNGTLINPGEVYSTIAHLGPITVEAGFLNELVIKNNRTLPEAGGGLCQVSTTLFRAVLNAGLPITERANHSYRVGYYERNVGPGLDATIYDPSPDFKWKNDLGVPVYVQSSLKGDTITFDLYGTGDGRVATVGKPQILEETPAGSPIYIDTDTLLVGQLKQVETPHAGAKTTVDYVVTKDGKEINKQTFRSTYKPWPAQYLRGTRQP